MPTKEDDLITLGKQVIRDGRIVQLQARLGFSDNAMAEMMYVTGQTFKGWKTNPLTRVSGFRAREVGRAYRDAVEMIQALTRDGVDIASYVPFHQVAGRLGVPNEFLLSLLRRNEVPGWDWEVLGLWMHRKEADYLYRKGLDFRVAA